MISSPFRRDFTRAALDPNPGLANAALMIARIEYPTLDPDPYLQQLDDLGRDARTRLASAGRAAGAVPAGVDPGAFARIIALNDYLFGELCFAGNAAQYGDPRNSFLNEVLDRRTGIPITLSLLYIEVARRAGVVVDGINFPGHFLVRHAGLIIDPFHGGALLSEDDCRDLLRRHAGEEARLSPDVLQHATKPQILSRMLRNLKQIYIQMRSFPQARDVTDLLLAVDASAAHELRDRGLLAYQLEDFPAALRDLLAYLEMSSAGSVEEHEQQTEIWEHVKALRRRVASLN